MMLQTLPTYPVYARKETIKGPSRPFQISDFKFIVFEELNR